MTHQGAVEVYNFPYNKINVPANYIVANSTVIITPLPSSCNSLKHMLSNSLLCNLAACASASTCSECANVVAVSIFQCVWCEAIQV